jgi:hypothetical protein
MRRRKSQVKLAERQARRQEAVRAERRGAEAPKKKSKG